MLAKIYRFIIKAKCLLISRNSIVKFYIEGSNPLPLNLSVEKIERVQKFTYLGSFVSDSGGTEEDIASRIVKARAAFAHGSIWQSRKLTRGVKLKIFRSCVNTVLQYGCETWRVISYSTITPLVVD